MVYLSASSISDFIQCSQKVKYRFGKIKQIPTKGMTIGRIAHEAIEKGWQDKEIAYRVVQTLGRANELSRSDIGNMEFFMDIFFLNFRPYLREDDKVEYSFKLPLYDDVFIVGKMDRISNGNVYDWKTSSRISKRLDNDVQCIIYDYAYERIFGEPAKSINVCSLSKGNLVPYMKKDIYVKEVFENIIPRMIKTVKNSSFERTGMFNHSCFMCPYKQVCLGTGARDVEDKDPNWSV